MAGVFPLMNALRVPRTALKKGRPGDQSVTKLPETDKIKILVQKMKRVEKSVRMWHTMTGF